MLPVMERSPSMHGDEHWKSVPRFLYYEIEPVLLANEGLHASLHATERWAERPRFFRVDHTFVQPWSSALFAGRSLVLGTAEQPIEPTLHAFGANVIIAPYSAIAAATVSERPVREVIARELRVDLSRDACSTSIVLPFDGSSGDG
jgi:hypothetical protein